MPNNAWNHPSLIAAEALSQMTDNLTWGRMTTRDMTGKFVGNEMKIGDTINLRGTPDYEAKEFDNDGVNTVERQAIRNYTRPFTIEKIFDVTVDITSKEKALDLDSFTAEVISPAAYRLAEKIDTYIAGKAVYGIGIYQSADLMGSISDMALARAAANYQQLDPATRFCMVNPTLEAKLLGKDFFYSASIRGDGANQAALREGFLAKTMGFEFYGSNLFPDVGVQTWGTVTGTTDNGAGGNTNNRIGSKTLVITGGDGAVGTFFDHILIAGCRRPLIIASRDSATQITLTEPIMEIIPDNAAITTAYTGVATTLQGVMMDHKAIGLAMPALGAPSDKPSAVISNNGYSIRVVQGYDMDKKVEIMSLDVMVGAGIIDPRRVSILGDS